MNAKSLLVLIGAVAGECPECGESRVDCVIEQQCPLSKAAESYTEGEDA